VEFIIRKVLPEEADEYTVCQVSCWQAAYKGIVPNDYLHAMYSDKRVERCRKALSESEDSYCAELKGEMIGRLVFGKSRDEEKPDAGEIEAIYLTAPFWGKGFGKKMMDYAIAALKEQGCNEAIAWMLEENNRARLFYEKYGFTFDGAKKEIELGKALTLIRYVLNLR
jgi:GNAT superfamily N-acetyltransferase